MTEVRCWPEADIAALGLFAIDANGEPPTQAERPAYAMGVGSAGKDEEQINMNRRALLMGAIALSGGCSPGPIYRLRYRLDIRFRAGDRIHIGSSVMSMKWGDVGRAANLNGGDRYARYPAGEALVVNVGQRGKIFGLVSVPAIDEDGFQIGLPESAFSPLLAPGGPGESEGGENVRQRLSGLVGLHALAREHWPIMVRFRDLTDQTSVELVDRDDPSAVFGAGSAIESVTMEVVDAPVTRGAVARELPWINQLRGTLVPPVRGEPRSLAQRINRTHFIQDDER